MIEQNGIKKCPKCNTLKEIKYFNVDKTRSDGLKVYCKICDSYFYKKWDKDNIPRNEKRKKVLIFLSSKSCIDCGENNPVCLEFDHVRGQKKANISTMIGKNYNWETINKEIEKCEIRCSNCHQKRHAKEQKWYFDICPSGTDLFRKMYE